MKSSHWFPHLAERYRRLGYWTDDTFADHVDAHAARRPNGRALSDTARAITWAEVKRWTDAVAAGLVRLGVARDSVVATWLPNGIESYLMRIACEKAGLIWLPISLTSRQYELRPLLRSARAAVLVLFESARRDHWGEAQDMLPDLPELHILCLAGARNPRPGAVMLEEVAAVAPSADELASVRARSVRPNDVAMLQPTSGSSGAPKLCEYLLAGAVARGRAQAELFHLSERDVMVALVHGFGPSIPPLLAAPLAGAEVIVLDHLDTEQLLTLIERSGATIVCGVPPLFREIAATLGDGTDSVASVRIWYSTGMAMPPDLARTLEQRTNGTVLSGYGGVDFGWWIAPAPGIS